MSFAAEADEPPKWSGHIEAEGKWGTERSLSEIGVFIPLWQNEKTLLFTDLRGRLDDQDSREGNFGIGLRYQVNSEWIIGGYGFYDHRKTLNNNDFHQATVGLEALSENLEFRVNSYIPESKAKAIGPAGGSTTEISGGNFQITSTGAPQERALPGFDVEAGYKFDLPDNWEFWAYAGGFHFNAGGYDSVSGPRGRMELSYNNVPYLGEESRLTLGFETQTDNVRGDQSWGIARLRIPFDTFATSKNTAQYQLSALDHRMTTRVVRDIDIVNAEKAGAVTTETASYTNNNGKKVSHFIKLDATDDVLADITAPAAASLIILDGSVGVINTTNNLNVNSGKTVIGGGNAIQISTASGKSGTVTLPGTAATVTRGGAIGPAFVVTGDRNLVSNLTISGGKFGLFVSNSTNTILENLTVQNTGDDTIRMSQSSDITIKDTTLTAPNGGGEEGIQFNNTNTDITLNNVSIENANIGFIYATGTATNHNFNNVTVDQVVNGFQVQAGATLNSAAGAITATNVGNVDCQNLGTMNGSTLTINAAACP